MKRTLTITVLFVLALLTGGCGQQQLITQNPTQSEERVQEPTRYFSNVDETLVYSDQHELWVREPSSSKDAYEPHWRKIRAIIGSNELKQVLMLKLDDVHNIIFAVTKDDGSVWAAAYTTGSPSVDVFERISELEVPKDTLLQVRRLRNSRILALAGNTMVLMGKSLEKRSGQSFWLPAGNLMQEEIVSLQPLVLRFATLETQGEATKAHVSTVTVGRDAKEVKRMEKTVLSQDPRVNAIDEAARLRLIGQPPLPDGEWEVTDTIGNSKWAGITP